MDKVSSLLQVYFDGQFWVGLFENEHKTQLRVCRVIFGAEPKDYEIYEYILQNYYRLKFSPPVASAKKSEKRINPKRVQREIKRNLQNLGVSTKSQQALKKQQEKNKQIRKENSKLRKAREKKYQFILKQQKKKEKHKGR